ncbi:MAG: Uma2 family endonuclease [Treponema sp.]|jgi:Uma2 family endonuclease|nr:Uma2 family endonuclease [Treponema sp.]
MADLAYAEEGRFTYADYKAWELNPGERYELIDGAAYAMAAPNTGHQIIAMTLYGEFYNFLKGKPCRPIPAPFDVRLFYQEDESDDTVVQPDLTVLCDPGKLGDEGCRGAPDLVMEILSPSNTAIEMERKLNLYQEAGVREYWVVDPLNRRVCVYLLKDDRYVPRTFRAADRAQSAILPGLELPLADVFG